MMQNLNDYYYYVQVVKYHGYTKASEALGITKSKLSRRISDLEGRLNVRLIQRNTRKFTVTELGQQFYAHCLRILEDVDEAENFIHSTLNDALCGNIKISCPVALVETPIGGIVSRFLQQNPAVHIQLMATNERVDVIAQGIDLAIRVRHLPIEDSDLVVRELDAWGHVLIASPAFLDVHGEPTTFQDLSDYPSVGFDRPKHIWEFTHQASMQKQSLSLNPRLKTDSFLAMKTAVKLGVGIGSLPKVFVRDELKSGELVQLFPEWELPSGVIHVAYASRQGMLPAVRAFLDYLLLDFRNLQTE